jgi:hypothetical protein
VPPVAGPTRFSTSAIAIIPAVARSHVAMKNHDALREWWVLRRYCVRRPERRTLRRRGRGGISSLATSRLKPVARDASLGSDPASSSAIRRRIWCSHGLRLTAATSMKPVPGHSAHGQLATPCIAGPHIIKTANDIGDRLRIVTRVRPERNIDGRER